MHLFLQVGQLAFRGIKTLNRIQSIVFDAAYKTNENLLVSAPTGAGKTNVAMLAVVHEIKNNITNGVIKKDAFKVIHYVETDQGLLPNFTSKIKHI